MKGANNTYFGNILEGITSLAKGLAITFRHLGNSRYTRKVNSIQDNAYFDQAVGIATIEYPHEAIPVPDNGRYRLHNEIDDCIVCDLCAKICPVNCIEIEAIKSTEEIGKTSDGSTKRIYAGVFNIDMAKCCYCGLCTTVCPTECITMTKTYDYSEFDVRNMVYHFSDLSPLQVEEKKKKYEENQKLKAKPAVAKPEVISDVAPAEGDVKTTSTEASAVKKPAFKPVIKPSIPKKTEGESTEANQTSGEEKKIEKVEEQAFPTETEAKKEESANEGETKEESAKPVVKKPVFKPVIKPSPKKPEGDSSEPKE